MKKKCSWRGAEEKCRRTGGRVKDWLNEWVPKWCDIFSQLWDGCGTITTLLAPELFDYVAGGGGFCKKWVDDTYVMHLYNFVRICWIVRSFSPPPTLNGCQTATLAEPKRTLWCRAIIKVQSICFRRHIRPVTQRLLNFNGKAGQDNKAGGSALRDYHFGVSNDRGCPGIPTTTFVEHQLIWSSFLLPLLAVKPVDVEGVEGMQVSLPCPLAASTSDKVYMVLWFRDGVGIPLYRWEILNI